MRDVTQNVQETGDEVLVSRKRDAAEDIREECQRAQGLRILSIRSTMGQYTVNREDSAAYSMTLVRLVARFGASISVGRRSVIS